MGPYRIKQKPNPIQSKTPCQLSKQLNSFIVHINGID